MMGDRLEYFFLGGMSPFDWTSMFALFAIAVIYFVAPALGYMNSGRGLLLASLWLLLGKCSLALVKFALIFFEMIEGKGSGSSSSSTHFLDSPTMLMLFFLMESSLFVMAMVFFVCGLARCTAQPNSMPIRRDLHDD